MPSQSELCRNSNGNHSSLGKKEFVITGLLEQASLAFPTGTVRAIKCEKMEHFTFLDYIFSGLEIALILAIDFTGSNGEPTSPESLHYIDMSKVAV